MLRVRLLFSILAVGCVDAEPLVETPDETSPPVVAGEAQVMELALAPSEYHCEAMTEAARTAVPPPPPVSAGASFAPRVRALCPPGEVAVYRQPAHQTIQLGPPRPPALRDDAEAGPAALAAGTYWYASVMKPTQSWSQSGVGASILMTNPAVYDQNDMVTSQMSIVRGSNYHLVEMGLRKFWDAFPRLMISQWSYGQFQDAAGFVRVHGVYGPGMPLYNYYGYAIQQYIRYDNGNWWIWFNDAWVGYFPGSIWSGAFTSGEMAHFYGEVYSAANRVPPITDMGNGLFSSHGAAAYMQGMCLHSSGPSCYLLVDGWRYVSNAGYYSLDYANGSYMRFGGNGGG